MTTRPVEILLVEAKVEVHVHQCIPHFRAYNTFPELPHPAARRMIAALRNRAELHAEFRARFPLRCPPLAGIPFRHGLA